MSDTQSYKKARICCNFDCRQGRDCPMERPGDSAFVGLVIVLASSAAVISSFLYFVWG